MNNIETIYKALNGKWPQRLDLQLSIKIGYALSLGGDRLIPTGGGADIHKHQFESFGVN